MLRLLVTPEIYELFLKPQADFWFFFQKFHRGMVCNAIKIYSISPIHAVETPQYGVSTIGCVYSIKTIILQSVWKTHFYSPVRRNALADDIQGKMNELIKVRLKKKIWQIAAKTQRTADGILLHLLCEQIVHNYL